MKDVFGAILKDQPNSVVLGDYNQDSQSQYTKNISDFGFEDIILNFEQSQGYEVEEFGFSMPKTPKFPAWRPDKICMPKIAGHLKPVDVQKIGAFCVKPYQNDDLHAIEKDGVVRAPSDHMGLIVDLKI